MFRSKLSVMCALFFFCAAFSFARVGLGGAFSYSASTSPHEFVSFTARTDVSPWCVFFNAHFKDNTISVFADDWFINERIAEHLDYFVLWGISGGVRFEEERFELATGCRFGAGLDFFLLKRHVELFAQAVWNPYFGIKKSGGDYSPLFRPVNFPCSAGIRIWGF
ncbi:MAG: hypothetical protein IJ158_12685 [Treponema sp.]|nr:hypothetical protein [Treponema sp.]